MQSGRKRNLEEEKGGGKEERKDKILLSMKYKFYFL